VWCVVCVCECECVCARARTLENVNIIANGNQICSETLEIHNAEKLQRELQPNPRQIRGNYCEAKFSTRYRRGGGTSIPHAP